MKSCNFGNHESKFEFRLDINESERQDLESMLMEVEFPNLLPPDAEDDEAMVEYAIALSLQQQEQQEQQSGGGVASYMVSCHLNRYFII